MRPRGKNAGDRRKGRWETMWKRLMLKSEKVKLNWQQAGERNTGIRMNFIGRGAGDLTFLSKERNVRSHQWKN